MTQHTDIVFTRHRGKGITIDHAPTHTRLDPRVLADRNTYLRLPEPDVIVFADQVVYRITGFEDCWLLLELIEDWRPAAADEPKCAVCLTPVSHHGGRICQRAPLTDEEDAELKTRWKERHGNGQAVHPVMPLNRENQP